MFRTNNEFLSELKPLVDDGIVASFPELAIRFAAFSPRIALVVPGAKSLEQIESNVANVLRGPLPKDPVDLINTLRAKYLPKMIN